ncbi:amidase [Fretibacter rubidus]|uniref:amidase n=1 Tax=Fretibacter rubidus TaxID=570162 RepID=UPI00352ADC51
MTRRVTTLLSATAVSLFVLGCAPQNTADKGFVVDAAQDYTASDLVSQTLPELAAQLQSGDITVEQLTRAYLARIDAVDKSGPRLQAVLSLNPNALSDARALDAKREAGEPLGALHGLPILLKDNIESKDPVATTAGALALADNITGRDAPLVAGLREAGAVIIGKANLSQWANFRSRNSMSGWSALGGQVRNPHSLDRNPCGSSSGSGAGVASSLAAGAVGTETNGSIICPSTINGVVGFKPTVGLVSQQYIVPISSSQDTAGPMTKTVRGAAMMLGPMAGNDVDYSAGLSADALRGQRIGVMRFAQGSHSGIQAQFDESLKVLTTAGAELIEIDAFDLGVEGYGGKSFSVLQYEFKATLNDYLASTPDTVETRTLSELIRFNTANTDVELPLFDQSILELSEARGPLSEQAYIDAASEIKLATGKNGIDRLLSEHNVVALVAPSGPLPGRIDPVNGDVWPDWAGAGYLAAVAGYPHLSVPMGTVRGMPIGLSFIGTAGDDGNILGYGYAFEQQSKTRENMSRAAPQYRQSAEDVDVIGTAMRPHALETAARKD